jgi:chromosome segregation ATPase
MSIRLHQDIKDLRENLDKQILANTEKENKVNLFKLSISNKIEENKSLRGELDNLKSEFDKLKNDLELYKSKSQKIKEIFIKEPIDNTELHKLQTKYDLVLIENETYTKSNDTLLTENNRLTKMQERDENQIAFQIEQNIVLNNENKKIRENFNINLNNYKNQITLLQQELKISNDQTISYNNEIQDLNEKLTITTKLAQLYTEYIQDQEQEIKNKKKMDKLVNKSIRK